MASLADLLRDPQFRSDVGNNARDFFQSASNTAASNVTAPIDGLAWLLRKAGVPIPQAPIGGSDWANNAGLMAEPKNKNSLASLLGEAAGNIAPIAGYAKAPEIAGGLNQIIKNANAPDTFNAGWHGQRGAVAWHGSPHKFDKFDASKIGTGEGVQAYGHGLYLAENPAVAGQYQKTLAADGFLVGDKVFDPSTLKHLNIKSMVRNGDFDGAIAKASQIAKDGTQVSPLAAEDLATLLQIKAQGGLTKNAGSMYKVDLPDSAIARMLDYDAPVTEAMRKPLSEAAMNQFGSGATGTSGEHLYKEIIANFKHAGHPNPTQAATDWLTKQGVPGMKYLDGGSRGAGQGSSNYVVFPGNESLLKILSRNGQNLP